MRQLEADLLRDWMRHLASRPHNVGSPFGKDVADFVAARFTEWGYDTAIEEFQVLFPTPRLRRLELVAPTRFTHHIYAPGFYTGYGVKTIPGVREAIEQRDWPLATTQIALAADTLGRFAAQVDRATEILSGSR